MSTRMSGDGGEEQDTSDETMNKIAKRRRQNIERFGTTKAYSVLKVNWRILLLKSNASVKRRKGGNGSENETWSVGRLSERVKDRQIANIEDELEREIALRQRLLNVKLRIWKTTEREKFVKVNQEAIKNLFFKSIVAADIANSCKLKI